MTDSMWQSALRSARGAWPAIDLPPEHFASWAEDRRRHGGALPDHLADLYLACAAAAGHPAALRILDDRVLSRIDPAVRRVDSAPAFVDEVRQALRVRLFVGEAGAPPRIAEYQARGPLLSWVRVAATRIALNLKRAERPADPAEDVLGELPAGEVDPEVRHLKTLYRAELAGALRAAVAALSERQRAVLRLHYLEGLRLAQIAALYQVHESTASRWVSGALEAVAADARQRLVAQLSLSASSINSLARLVQSNLDISIGRLLGAPAGE